MLLGVVGGLLCVGLSLLVWGCMECLFVFVYSKMVKWSLDNYNVSKPQNKPIMRGLLLAVCML